MGKKIDFYYFSGTGNTQFVVNQAVKSLETYGIQVSLKLIEKGYISLEPANELWIAFPANSKSVSPFIWRFLKSLPYSKGILVHVLVTLNNSVHILSPLYSLLTTKGYIPTSACEISMPNNMVDSNFDQDKDLQKFKYASEKVDRFVHNTMAGNFSWKSEFKGSKFISLLSRETRLPWISMRFMLKLETIPSKCIDCGMCAKQCPVKNIRKVNQVFIHGSDCQFCMKCVAKCPKKAIQVKGKKNIKFQQTQKDAYISTTE